jgi:hypothetical protein
VLVVEVERRLEGAAQRLELRVEHRAASVDDAQPRLAQRAADPGMRQAGEERLEAARWPGSTSSRKRLGVSANRRRPRSRRAAPAAGTRAASSSAPTPPANAISAAATASPPSERSWQASTSPRVMAACTAASSRGASARSTSGAASPVAPSRRASWLPPSSAPVAPSRSSSWPAPLRSIVIAWATSGTIESAVISSVGGIVIVRPPSWNSLFRLSLPEMNGARKASAPS